MLTLDEPSVRHARASEAEVEAAVAVAVEGDDAFRVEWTSCPACTRMPNGVCADHAALMIELI